jgi:uncharacterized protein YecT (DUF1311 family)
MKTLQTIGLLLLLSTFSSAYAGDCFKDGDVADCRVKAEQGHADAQTNLGWMYANGLGTTSTGHAASFGCSKPTLFSSDYEKSREGINLYLSDWFSYETCMLDDIANVENFSEFLEYFNEFYICAPDYTVAFNEWETQLISERQYYRTQDGCKERNLVKLDKLLNAVWSHIKHLSGGKIPNNLLIEQRAWLSFYELSCHNDDDHPLSMYMHSSCKQREYEFRILSLSRHIGEGGNHGWPAKDIDYLLNHMSIL